MTTPIADVIRIIAEDWAATTPPDITSIGYTYADYRPLDTQSVYADRSFFFLPPKRDFVEAETSDSSQVNYTLEAVLVLSDNGRTEAEFNAAIGNEQSLLMRAVEGRTDWTDGGQVQGVWSVETQTVDVERDEDSGAALLTFTFTALVGES